MPFFIHLCNVPVYVRFSLLGCATLLVLKQSKSDICMPPMPLFGVANRFFLKKRSKSAFSMEERVCCKSASSPCQRYLRTYSPYWLVCMRLSVNKAVFGKVNNLLVCPVYWSLPGTISRVVSMNSFSRSVSVTLRPLFWNINRSLPTSMPLVCMNRLSGKRNAVIRLQRCTR